MNEVLLVGYVVSFGLIASFAVGDLLGLAWRWRASAGEPHPWAPSAPLLAALVPALGTALALAALVPSRPLTWIAGRCACEAYDGPHLCPLHLVSSWPIIALAAPLAFVMLARRLPTLLRILQSCRDAEHLAAEGDGNSEVTAIDAGRQPTAYVAGLRRPRLFVDRSWWSELTERERGVILAHERAHVERREPLSLAVLEALLAAFAPRARGAIVRDWALAAEIRADATAAQQDGDPLFVAETLCRYARSVAPRGALGLGGRALEARVRALIEPATPTRPAPGVAVCVGLSLLPLVGGHVLHHVLEAFLA